MAESFFQYRQDCPFPLPINKGGFHGQSMMKIKCKIEKNQLLLVLFLQRVLSLSWPSATTTVTISLTTIISTNPAPYQWYSSHRRPPFLSPTHFLLLSPSATDRQLLHHYHHQPHVILPPPPAV